jgi:DNA-binding response OmpR family regulator
LRARGLHVPVIFITAYPGENPRITSGLPGVIACLPKPFAAEQLLACVEAALRQVH